MSEAFVGEIRMFAGGFAPRGWALCDGQLLAVAQNDALFSLLGTIYGGDGRSTFGLPDMRGRVPVHWGSGPGLSPRRIGQKGGAEKVTLVVNQLPVHSHRPTAVTTPNAGVDPSGKVTARSVKNIYRKPAQNDIPMSVAAIAATGGSQPHGNMVPFQCVNFIIALYGTYPSRA